MTFNRTEARGLRCAVSALALIAAGAPFSAYAQSQAADTSPAAEGQQAKPTLPADTQQQADADAGQDVVVTGSLIPQRNAFSGMEGLTVLDKQDLTESGYASTGDALQSVAITQGTSQINNAYGGFVVNGGTGTNTVGLRGLGPARTLVLLNGHRLEPSGTQGSVLATDLNVLPTAILNRIEVLKAGASSIYGSDAVAGVINILTDTNLNGVVVEGQTNVPQNGGGVDTTLSVSFGYHSDRLKLIGSLEYNHRSQMAVGDQGWASNCPISGYLNGEGSAFGSGDTIDPATGRPRCYTIDNGGVTINTLGLPVQTAVARTGGAVGSFSRFAPNPNVTTGLIGFEGVGTYDRDTFDPRMLQSDLITPVERYTGFLQAGYELQALGNAELYVELLGNQRHSSTLDFRQLSLDYPTGSPLLAAISASTGRDIIDGDFGPAQNGSTNGLDIGARAFIGYGNYTSEQKVSFVRASGGLRGDFFFDKWKYDFYVSKSFNDGTYSGNQILIDHLAKSMDVVQTAPGVFACASALSGVDPNCVAAPVLSAAVIGGNIPQAYRNYIEGNVVGHTQFREFDTSFNVNGPLFKLPGGDASLALGAEYRQDSINDQPGADSINGNILNFSSATPTVGSDHVWELFGELYLPIVTDKPFVHSLTLDASGRFTDYRSYGSNTTYKVQGQYEPVKGLGFRASYGTSYRAPALAEQFVGATSGFLSSASDPCDDYLDSNNPNIVKNCGAIGLPKNDTNPDDPAGNFRQLNGVKVLSVGGAETGLKAETSTNLSGGVVFSPVLPQAFGHLQLSADYFDIKVNNGVNQLDGGTILSLCYGAASFDPTGQYCRLAQRDASGGLTVTTSYLNISTDIRRGIEFNFDYSRDIGPGNFELNAAVTKYLEQSTQLFAGDPKIDYNGTIATPDWSGSLNAQYRMKNVSFHYGLDWISGSQNRTYHVAAIDSGTGVYNPDDEAFYRANYYWKVPNYFLHNASITLSNPKFDLTVGVRNIFNTAPPSISIGWTNVIGNAPLYSGYDYFGRTFFANVTAKF
jgi:outer membrane receptor protein involved in Fe transport